MEPIQQPPKTFKQLEESGEVIVDRELGVVTTINPKTGQREIHNLPKGETDMSQDLELDPATGTPKITRDPSGREWVTSKSKGKQPAPPAPLAKETPEQKQQAEADKEAQKIALEAAHLTIETTGADGKKSKRPATQAEKNEFIRDYQTGKNTAKAPMADAAPAMPELPADSEGWTPGERVMHYVDAGRSPSDVEELITTLAKDPWRGKPAIDSAQAGSLRAWARRYREYKQRSKATPITLNDMGSVQPRPSQSEPDGTIARDANGNRAVMRGGQWVPLNAGE